jgi:DNA helicase HerA-like ATPase
VTARALHLGKGLTLPLDAVSRTFGILAVRGAGKSNTAAVMAEEMFAAGLPFVVIDPVGSWYGLRSSADGTSPGLPIPIFGGKHGDVPLEHVTVWNGSRDSPSLTGSAGGLGSTLSGSHAVVRRS